MFSRLGSDDSLLQSDLHSEVPFARQLLGEYAITCSLLLKCALIQTVYGKCDVRSDWVYGTL